MKKSAVCVVVLLVACGLAAGQAQQKVLYSFKGAPNDGSQPVAKLVFDAAGNLYGTTMSGGTVGWGTVFELSPVPVGTWKETVLYNFCQNFDGYSCLDGGLPEGAVVIDSAGNLYGTTYVGGGYCAFGSEGCGTVFQLSPPSLPGGTWKQSVLYNFCQAGDINCSDGALPYGKLTFDASGNLYGTTSQGGVNGVGGSVFELSHGPNSWTETVLYSFCSTGEFPVCPDGSAPRAGVAFDTSGHLYGTTSAGGSSTSMGGGVVYKLSPGSNGWKQTILFAFPSATGSKGGQLMGAVNFDSVGNLYSTAFGGGQFDHGGVFRLSPKNGGSENTLSFSGPDGAGPAAGVLVDPRNGTLYGTTSGKNWDDLGTVFKIVGKKLTVLYHFNGGDDGAMPMASLIPDKSGRHLFGTAKSGGQFGQGVVFEITP